MQRQRMVLTLVLTLWSGAGAFASEDSGPTQASAERMIRIAETVLQPVYAPLAEHLVHRCGLAQRRGLGIDVGGGSGHLVVELSRRTPHLQWIDADYNPYFRDSFQQLAQTAGVGGRVRFATADVHALPFADACAEVVVSRGSFPFWRDLEQGLAEIQRVLKPGGVAYIGRGFSANLPVDTARAIRARQHARRTLDYDPADFAAAFQRIMAHLGIDDYEIIRPRPPGSEGINYGIWLEFHRPITAAAPAQGAPTDPRYTLDAVEVSGRRWRDVVAAPRTEAAGLESAVSVVTQEAITRQGAKTAISALDHIPGAWVESRGRKVKQFFSIRGQRYPYPDFALDGVWQREFAELPYFFAATDLAEIRVMRSSGSLLAGPSGLVGVVDIVPRRYTRAQTAVALEYGSFATHRLRASHGDAAESWSYALSAQHSASDGPSGRHAAEEMLHLRASAYGEFASKLSLQAHLFHLNGRRELAQALPPAAVRFRAARETFDPFRATLLTSSARYLVNDRTSALLQLSLADRRHTFVDEAVAPHTRVREKDHEWTLNTICARRLSRANTLRLSALYNHWISPTGKRFYLGRRGDLETYSLAMVDEQRWGRWVVDAGLRWARTHMNDYGSFNVDGRGKGLEQVQPITDTWEPGVWTGTLGAAWYPAAPISLHVNLGAGYLRPRRGTLDTELTRPGDEVRRQLDLGMLATRPGWGSLRASIFWMKRQDAITLSGRTVVWSGRLLELYENQDQDQVGVELEGQSPRLCHIFRVFANVTAMRARVDTEGIMRRNREVPRCISSVGMYADRGRGELNLFAKYVSAYRSTRFVAAPPGSAPAPRQLGDFVSLDLTGGYALPCRDLQLVGEIRNLMDDHYATVVGYPDYGRRITLGFRWPAPVPKQP